MRRTISLVVTLLLVAVVAATVTRAVHDVTARPVVRGVVTPDLKPVFRDARVRAAFAHEGIDVKVDVVPDAQLAKAARNSKYAFAIAPSSFAAHDLARARTAKSTTVAFSTPLAVEAAAATAGDLQREGVASVGTDGRWSLNLAKFAALANPTLTVGPSWSSAANVLAAYLVADAVDPHGSVRTVADVDKVVNEVITRFGGSGSLNVVAAPVASVRPDSVMLYPDPDVSADATIAAFNRGGTRVASALAVLRTAAPLHEVALPSDDVLAALATRVGAAARIDLTPAGTSPVVKS